MTFSRQAFTSILTISACAIIFGCGGQTDKESENVDLAMQLNQKAMDLYQSGNTNGAIQTLESGLENKAIPEESRQRLFGSLISLHLSCNQTEIAEKKTLDAVSKSAEYLSAGANNIISYYRYNNETEALLNWCTKLIEMDIPEQLKSNAFYQSVSIYLSDQQLDKALQLIEEKIDQFKADTRNQILKSLAYQAIGSEDFDGAEKILNLGTKLFPEDTDLKNISLIGKVDILFNSKQWDKAVESFIAAVAQLDDTAAQALLTRSTSLLKKNGQIEKSTALCKALLTKHKDLTRTCDRAATTYIANAKGNHSETLNRITFLHSEKINDHTLFSCYRGCFYDILGSDNADILQQLKDVSEKISASLTSEKDAKYMKTLALELAFIMEDYGHAIELVNSGIEGKDESWAKLAVSKMKAHQCLKQNKPEEAIKHFREFMNMIASEGETQSDPTTGILHSKEMLLGRNAKRIGDIYLSINKKDDAIKSYIEAEQYYNDAKHNMDKKQTRSLKLIDEETAELKDAKAKVSAS